MTAHDASGALIKGTATFENGNLAILVIAPTGSTVSATKDGAIYTATESEETPSTYEILVPEYGTYTVTATLNGYAESARVTVEQKSVELNPAIPQGYTQLEYIESTGTQYINTGLSLEGGFVFHASVMPTDVNGDYHYFGSSAKSGGKENRNITGIYNGKFTVGSGVNYSGSIAQNNEMYQIESCTILSQYYLKTNGTLNPLTKLHDGNNALSNLSIYMFAINLNGSAKALSKVRVYGQSLVYSDLNKQNLVACFYPAKNSDDEIGLYDTVRNTFYTNAGTGTFIAGPEVA